MFSFEGVTSLSLSLSLSLPLFSQTYTADPQLDWVDVREWVVETYPWQPSLNVMKLRTLNPEDVGWNHGKEEWEWDCLF